MSKPQNEAFEPPFEEAEAALDVTPVLQNPARWRILRRFRALAMAVPVLPVTLAALWAYSTGGRWAQTENAYIKADKAQISARVSGPIVQVDVRDNQEVAAGDALFSLDASRYETALAAARAARDETIGQIMAAKANYRQKIKERQLLRETLAFARRELKRREALIKTKVVSRAQLDNYQHKRDVAAGKLAAKEQEIAVLRAMLGDPDAPPQQHPRVRGTIARVEQAALDLAHTKITAPISGIAAHVPVVGNFVVAGTPVMTVVASSGLWVEANFKETQLAHVRPGQKVLLDVDGYPDQQWQGRVSSINPASGAEFSLLPPQNASGNWVKVVQRIPVRIAIEAQKDAPPLRAGMSVKVRIDTGKARGLGSLLRAPLRWIGKDDRRP